MMLLLPPTGNHWPSPALQASFPGRQPHTEICMLEAYQCGLLRPSTSVGKQDEAEGEVGLQAMGSPQTPSWFQGEFWPWEASSELPLLAAGSCWPFILPPLPFATPRLVIGWRLPLGGADLRQSPSLQSCAIYFVGDPASSCWHLHVSQLGTEFFGPEWEGSGWHTTVPATSACLLLVYFIHMFFFL